MLKDIFRHLSLWFKTLCLDKYEKKFIAYNAKTKLRRIDKNKYKKYILLQVVTDYYYLTYYKTLIEDKKFSSYQFLGLWPYVQQTVRKRFFILEILYDFYNRLFYFFLFYKWSKLYRSIGIKKIEKINLNLSDNKNFFIPKISKKNSLLQYKMRGINIGDLLYDTYLRFRASPTVFLKDPFLLKIIKKAYMIIENLELLSKKYKIFYFFTSYSSYIHHGLPVRYFLKKKIPVFSGKNNSQYNKKLSINDNRHTENFLIYKKLAKKIKKNQTLLSSSEQNLKIRFLSNKKKQTTMSYLHIDTYGEKKNKTFNLNILKKIDGVLFLHDFYDSPHDWGKLSFDDFYLWTVYTLNLIKKYSLKIAVKPHPNSWHNSRDSVLIFNRLQKKFPEIVWMDKDFPNKIIFKNIKYGISCTGTVLFELAYHGIKAISCGTHPGINFNFTIHAHTKFQYKYNLLNIKKIKLPSFSKKDLLAYNYLYYYYNMDALKTTARLMNLKEIDFATSKGLEEFTLKYKNYVSAHK
jgi:hypothetical protein